MRFSIVSGLVVSAVVATSPPARASCDTLALTNQPNDVIVGEIGSVACNSGGCYFEPYNRPTAGACWRGSDGVWHIELLSCDSETPTGPQLVVYTYAGDDRVAVLGPEHTLYDPTLLPTPDGYGAMPCGDTGSAIGPWSKAFRFGITAYLGEGTDLFHGTDQRDVVWTNAPIFSGGVWTSLKDASTPDLACTAGGDDTIYGDDDDTYSIGTEDWIDGGTGSDFCDADYGRDGSDVSDVQRNCETAYDAYPDLPYLNLIHCEDSDDPLHDW